MINYNIDDVKNYIKSYLGSETINVELNDTQLTFQISEQQQTISRYIPTIRRVTIELVPGMRSYNLRDVDNREIISVFQVVRLNENNVFYNQLKLDPLLHPYNVDDFISIMQLINMRRKFLNTDPNFDYDPNLQILYFYPPITNMEKYQIIDYQVTPEIHELTEYNYRWLKRYQLQISKEILGRIRSKYTGVNTPLGNIQLDGNTLLNEQQQEKDKLLEELKQRITADILKYSKFVG